MSQCTQTPNIERLSLSFSLTQTPEYFAVDLHVICIFWALCVAFSLCLSVTTQSSVFFVWKKEAKALQEQNLNNFCPPSTKHTGGVCSFFEILLVKWDLRATIWFLSLSYTEAHCVFWDEKDNNRGGNLFLGIGYSTYCIACPLAIQLLFASIFWDSVSPCSWMIKVLGAVYQNTHMISTPWTCVDVHYEVILCTLQHP